MEVKCFKTVSNRGFTAYWEYNETDDLFGQMVLGTSPIIKDIVVTGYPCIAMQGTEYVLDEHGHVFWDFQMPVKTIIHSDSYLNKAETLDDIVVVLYNIFTTPLSEQSKRMLRFIQGITGERIYDV